MRIGILTLPLHTNYGGLLQAYALKSFLEALGHEVVVIDPKEKMAVPKPLRAPFVYASRAFKRLLKGRRGPEVFRELRFARELPVVGKETGKFVQKYIAPRLVDSYSQIGEGEYDAFIVGSDQVWRPKYFPAIEDAFLAFTEGWDVKRLSYAASFGTDELEYDYQMLERCSELLGRFDGVSVREQSAVEMCSHWFDRDDAVHVVDPVMLLDAGHYRTFAAGTSPAKDKILTYILDPSKQKHVIVDFFKRVTSNQVHDASVKPYDRSAPLQQRVVPALEEWLSCFADAGMVVTDSFHGCVLSILMHRPFVVVENSSRGLSRIKSLLEMLGLEDRLVHGIDPSDDGEYFLADPDWDSVDALLEQMREKSMNFLIENLK